MALKTLVKVGGVTNLSDARYCAGMGVELLGFRAVDGQENFVSSKQFQEIRGWVTGPQIVAEIYGIKTSEELNEVIENYRPDYLEFGLAELQSIGSAISLPFILALDNGTNLPSTTLKPAYVLLPHTAAHLERLLPEHEVLLIAETMDQVQAVVMGTGITGIALTGGNEIKPGLKDFDDLAQILEALETD